MSEQSDGDLAVKALGAALPLFILFEVNHPTLSPHSQLAVFVALGLGLCFLAPTAPRSRLARVTDIAFCALLVLVCLYLVVHTEPFFRRYWLDGQSLGDRAGAESRFEIGLGGLGLLLVLEGARRAVGLALPLLSLAFLAYAWLGGYLPAPQHPGYSLERIVSQAFLQSQGVFGVALHVMFSYVFLFVVFGAVLEATGATQYLIDTSRHFFRRSRGGPAKVAVVSSGLMGSISGSAVANVATTGTITIPLMKSAGFPAHVAAGIEAAASSGGALMPPVMGAGAYMMLELVDPPVTYLAIIRAALIPACLYYLSLLLLVHFQAGRQQTTHPVMDPVAAAPRRAWEGVVLAAGLLALVVFLNLGFSPFRAVTLTLGVTLGVATLHPRTRLGPRTLLAALASASRSGVSLIAAAASVGVVIGIVVLTGIGTRLPAQLLALSSGNLMLALFLIMVSSIVLGVGLPSAVCYLLMATLIGPVLGDLGVVPLAAHLFIFYFGMMSMVTPPVALAAFVASSIAGADFTRTALAAVRFSLVGFTLPFLFVLRPELLMLTPAGTAARPLDVVIATGAAIGGIVPLAAAMAGYLFHPLAAWSRGLLLVAAALALFPGDVHGWHLSPYNLAGIAILVFVVMRNRRPG